MIQANKPCDADIHRAACMIAKRFVALISGILRPEEEGEALREGYLIAREIIEDLESHRSK